MKVTKYEIDMLDVKAADAFLIHFSTMRMTLNMLYSLMVVIMMMVRQLLNL